MTADPRTRLATKRGWILVVLTALAAGGLIALPSLDLRFSPRSLLPDASELDALDQQLAARFGLAAEPPVIVRVHAPDVLAPAALRRIDALTRELRALPAVRAVRGPTSVLLPAVVAESSDAELDALLTLTTEAPEDFAGGLR